MAVSKHVDVLIVGAGISGIDAAYRLQERCPRKSYLILEARERVGGTGPVPLSRRALRSDMFTLGFPFRPWRSDQAIVGGPAIRQYVEDTAREFGIFDRIQFKSPVTRASWSSSDSRWTVESKQEASPAFLWLASGYYAYAQGYRPRWPGEDAFSRPYHPSTILARGPVTPARRRCDRQRSDSGHPRSGAREKAAHVTMVQRTPSYIVSRPSRDRTAGWLQRRLPPASRMRWSAGKTCF